MGHLARGFPFLCFKVIGSLCGNCFPYFSFTQKKNRRIQALKTSTVFTKDEKEDYMQYMTLDYMSSEHSESESKDDEKSGSSEDETNTSKVKVFSVSALPWRSAELRDLMYRLDRKSKRKRSAKSTNMTLQRKNKGIISKRPAPEDAPLFALAQ